MGRTITKDKYHNNREEQEKQRRREVDAVKEEILKINDEIEVEQTMLEEEQERNLDPVLLKR